VGTQHHGERGQAFLWETAQTIAGGQCSGDENHHGGLTPLGDEKTGAKENGLNTQKRDHVGVPKYPRQIKTARETKELKRVTDARQRMQKKTLSEQNKKEREKLEKGTTRAETDKSKKGYFQT